MKANHIVIVGGGTSGWMAANLLATRLRHRKCSITVIEPSTIPTVGVGEGSTPYFKDFFDAIGVKESEWMPACQATFKTGIAFPNWSRTANQKTYFHPFYSEIDAPQVEVFFAACEARRQGYDANAHPDEFFVSHHLYTQSINPNHVAVDCGYHFDSALLAKFLKTKATQNGVVCLDDEVASVSTDCQGNIDYLRTNTEGLIKGDFYLDCTGFRGLLIKQALNSSTASYQDKLFCNAAIALPVEHSDDTKALNATISRAESMGWMWNIPLQNRLGVGLVYSQNHVEDDRVLETIKTRFDLSDEQVNTARKLSWEPQRLQQHWIKNCVAIGLSQGFLEPLEAAMLNITQRSIELLLDILLKGDSSSIETKEINQYNEVVNGMFDGTCDYIQAHYLLNSRNDSEFWRDVRANTNLSEGLKDILETWHNNQSLNQALIRHPSTQIYLKTSWYCLLSGLGCYAPSQKTLPQHSAAIISNAKLKAHQWALSISKNKSLTREASLV